MFELKLDERLASFVSSNNSCNSLAPDELESQHSVSVGAIMTAADTITRKNLEAKFKLEVRTTLTHLALPQIRSDQIS